MITNNIASQYSEILNFTYEVINSLKGKQETDDRQFIGEQLAAKIFLHAATIQYLRNGSNITLKAYPDGSHVVDFASILVITRAILETYLNLFEIFFEPQNDDEFEYRYAVYQLRGLKVPEITTQNNSNANSQSVDFTLKIQQRNNHSETLRDRIQRTSHFKALDTNQQNQSLNGSIFPKRNREEIAKQAGFGKKTFQKIYVYLSGYTHGDSLSILQIKDALSDEQKGHFIELSIELIMVVLSHLIRNYAERFPEARAVFDAQPTNKNLIVRLAEQASAME